jgi:hypothetical protein
MSKTDFSELPRSQSNDELQESLREIRISLSSINRMISYLEEKEVDTQTKQHTSHTPHIKQTKNKNTQNKKYFRV